VAAQRARAHGFISELPDGYGTDIGEAGQRLSSGQRQRLTLARALVADPPVLVLDEPTSFLDRQAEAEFVGALVELARTRNVVAVTHSPAMLSAASTITIIDQGRIMGTGPAAEMLARMRAAPRMAAPTPAAVPAATGTGGA